MIINIHATYTPTYPSVDKRLSHIAIVIVIDNGRNNTVGGS